MHTYNRALMFCIFLVVGEKGRVALGDTRVLGRTHTLQGRLVHVLRLKQGASHCYETLLLLISFDAQFLLFFGHLLYLLVLLFNYMLIQHLSSIFTVILQATFFPYSFKFKFQIIDPFFF